MEPTETQYAVGEAVPELVLHIEGVSGASGPNGEFQPGDTMAVDFTLEKENGDPWTLVELNAGEALVSGPSFNYQRVLPSELDLAARATETTPGHFHFTFVEPLPAVFAAPYNDSGSFGQSAGELTGRDLLDGTYTVGLSVTWDFKVGAVGFRRVGEDTLDFIVGTGAGGLVPRAVTSAENCNRCHGALQAHDGRYRKLELCLMCHTSGAEDANDPAIEGGTPGTTIDSRVMFHKIHSGRFLPSVNGMTTRQNGSRNYANAPKPLRYARPSGVVRDFSDVGFPVMPNRILPMPRDTGYDTLTPQQQAQEDLVRSGPTKCAVCHGDPDGAGPIEAPAQGTLSNVPSRRACGACHDDVVFSNSYSANGQSMPPQPNDQRCNSCHQATTAGALSPIGAHVHPLARPGFDAGLNVAFTNLVEAGSNDGDGRLDPGEKIALEFSLTNDAGLEVAPTVLAELRFLLSGPTTNFQVLYDAAIPTSLVSGTQPFQLVLPERVQLELLGRSTAALDVFQSQRFPHRLGQGVATELLVRTGTSGGASVLARSAAHLDNFVDVVDATGFERGDRLVIDDGVPGLEEYLRVQFVDGRRLWFSSPDHPEFAPDSLRAAHAPGASVLEVQLTPRASPFQYTLDAATGTIHEVSEFGNGNAVIVSYTTDYQLPAEYPAALNGSPDLDDQHGKWTGKSLVSGTYTAALTAVRALDFRIGTSTTSYRSSSPSATRDFLVGDAFELEPYALVPDQARCDECHQELGFHGGTYRGFDTCILCHGASGSEDLPRYVAADAPETPGRSVEFRTILHKIHRGRELTDDGYQVAAAGTAAYPDNFAVSTYHHFSTLPAFPGRTLECARCHGPDNTAALLPADREHPTEQVRPLQIWRPACATCHDNGPVTAHFDSNTAPNGGEACAICHERGEFEDALVAHQALLEPR